ncbi:MAG: hypothetical protein RLZZ500_2487 [Bacteroidota bacterium]|jgi:ribosomal-protein-alanine N-acetyltransferase
MQQGTLRMKKQLETARLLLEWVDATTYQQHFLHDSEEILQEKWNLPVARIKQEKERATKGYETANKSLLLFLIRSQSTSKYIGWCGYHTWYLDHQRAEIGYGLYADEFKQQGIMSEALEAVLHYGFDTMNLQRVEAFIGRENTASKKLVQKMGFQEEGCLRAHYFTQNQYEDSLVFGLLASEFNSK